MPDNYPPDLNALPDTPQEQYWVKRCLRWLSDRQVDLRRDLDLINPSGTTSLSDLERRVGVLERGLKSLEDEVSTAPASLLAYGRWQQTSSHVGAGSYVWDTEDLNSGGVLTRQAGDTQILIGFTGVLCVQASLAINNMVAVAAAGELYQNATLVSRGYGPITATNFSQTIIHAILSVTSGDFVELKNSGFDRYGSALGYTVLSLHRVVG